MGLFFDCPKCAPWQIALRVFLGELAQLALFAGLLEGEENYCGPVPFPSTAFDFEMDISSMNARSIFLRFPISRPNAVVCRMIAPFNSPDMPFNAVVVSLNSDITFRVVGISAYPVSREIINSSKDFLSSSESIFCSMM